ncbi:MAG: multi-domain regulatory protein, partial [uncultured Rubrobacteraceae bacterium]
KGRSSPRPRGCSSPNAPGPPPPSSLSPKGTPPTWRRSAGGWRGCRWRWSWPRPRRSSSIPPRSFRGWTGPYRSPGRAICPRGSARCGRRWTGASSFSRDQSGNCSGASRCSPGGSPSRGRRPSGLGRARWEASGGGGRARPPRRAGGAVAR